MRILGRILGGAAVVALLAGPAMAQQKGPARYGEEDKAKTPSEIAAERDAEKAYRRSLGNIPEQKSTDPWGTMRGDSAAPKAAAPAKSKAKAAEGAASKAK